MVLACLLGSMLELVFPLFVSLAPSEPKDGELQLSIDLLAKAFVNVILLAKAIHLLSLGAQYPNQPVTY